MSNNFSADSNCVAVWNLDNGNLIVDSKGTNTLTPVYNPQNDIVNYKRGDASFYNGLSGSTHLKLLDGNASANFPLRTGDTNKKITMCGWIRPTNNGFWNYIFGKTSFYYSNRQGIGLGACWGVLYIHWGDGSWATDHNTNFTFVVNNWYHLGLVADGVTKAFSLRIWDETNNTITNFNSIDSGQMGVGSQEFRIGYWNDDAGGGCFVGQIDEVVVFNRCLSIDEIDLIRNNMFGPQETEPTRYRIFPRYNQYRLKQTQENKRIFPIEI